MRPIVNVVLLCALISIALADTGRILQEGDIRKAVFRYQFKDPEFKQQEKPSFYCLSLGETIPTDPSDDFLRRFAYNRPPVQKASACGDRNGGVVDKRTGKRAVIFYIMSITWISDTAVTVEGGYVEGNVGGADYVYTVNREKRKWKVANGQMRSISANPHRKSSQFVTEASAFLVLGGN